LENRDISQLSDEELLSLISKEEITNDEITLNKKHLDITNVMAQYKIERGNIPISPVLLFKILKFHVKNKIDPDEFFMYLSTILDVDKDGYFHQKILFIKSSQEMNILLNGKKNTLTEVKN